MAELLSQPLEIPLASGLQEGVDPRVMPLGPLLRVENLDYNQAGALTKRWGLGALPSAVLGAASPLPRARRLGTRGAELLAVGLSADTSQQTIYSLAPSAEAWAAKDDVAPCVATHRPIVRDRQGDGSPHVCRVAGRLVYVYATIPAGSLTNAGIWLKVVDETTGAVLVNERLIDHASVTYDYVGAVAVGDRVAILYSTSTKLVLRLYDVAIDTISGPTTVVSSPITYFDISGIDSTFFAIAYRDSGTNVRLEKWNASTIALVLPVNLPSVGDWPVFIRANPTNILVATTNTAGVGDYRLVVRKVTTSGFTPVWLTSVISNSTPTTRAIFPFVSASGEVVVFWEQVNVTPQLAYVRRLDLASGVPTGSVPRNLYGAIPWARPFARNGLTYAVCADGLILCLDDTTDEAAPLTVVGLTSTGAQKEDFYLNVAPAPHVLQVGSVDLVPIPVVVDLTADTGGNPRGNGVDALSLDWSPTQSGLWGSAEAQECLAQSGAFTGWFDGQSVVEQGFLRGPEITASVANGGGSIDVPGSGDPDFSYVYLACYEWYDEAGNLHRSAPSAPCLVTLNAVNHDVTVTLAITTLPATRRGDSDNGGLREATIAVYRSQHNEPRNLFRLFPHQSEKAPVNDRGLHDVAYVDIASDATILGLGLGQWTTDEGGTIYYEGGVLPGSLAPPSLAICSHARRLWLASSEDPKSVYFTREFVRFEAPAWPASFLLRVDDSPDGVTALASLDDKLVIFTRSRVYYATADAPNDAGAGNYPQTILVTTSAGCVDARSVLRFEGGIIFQGPSGLMLLDRSLQLSFVGQSVQTTAGPQSTLLGAALDPAGKRMFWALEPPDGPAYLLEYNYSYSAWLTHSLADTGSVSALTVRNGALVVGETNGIGQERYGDTPALDGAGAYPVGVVVTPWIHPGGVDGWQRTRHLILTLARLSDGSLTVEVCLNYDETVRQTKTWQTVQLAGLPVMRLDLHLDAAIQKASAVRFRIYDSPPGDGSPEDTGPVTGAGQSGFSLAGLALEIGMKKGRPKVNAPNRS